MRSYLIGRAPECDIHVNSPYASPRHAVLFEDGKGRWWVRDLGSTNGTRILRDGRDHMVTFTDMLLQYGDVILVGRMQIPFTWKPIRVTAVVEEPGA